MHYFGVSIFDLREVDAYWKVNVEETGTTSLLFLPENVMVSRSNVVQKLTFTSVLLKRTTLRNIAKFTRKHLWRTLFLIKIQANEKVINTSWNKFPLLLSFREYGFAGAIPLT